MFANSVGLTKRVICLVTNISKTNKGDEKHNTRFVKKRKNLEHMNKHTPKRTHTRKEPHKERVFGHIRIHNAPLKQNVLLRRLHVSHEQRWFC